MVTFELDVYAALEDEARTEYLNTCFGDDQEAKDAAVATLEVTAAATEA